MPAVLPRPDGFVVAVSEWVKNANRLKSKRKRVCWQTKFVTTAAVNKKCGGVQCVPYNNGMKCANVLAFLLPPSLSNGYIDTGISFFKNICMIMCVHIFWDRNIIRECYNI